jgi:hypothetical protein
MNSPAEDDGLFSRAIGEAVEHSGRETVYRALLRLAGLKNNPDDTLTIVTNLGVHGLPNEYLRGSVYVASHGSLDFSTPESIHREFSEVLKRLAQVLKSKEWHTVYIVPFGPAPLSMQIKLLVYRVCGIETIEVMHHPSMPRVDISINLRELIVQSEYPAYFGPLTEAMLNYGVTPGITGLTPPLPDKK